MKKSEKMLVLVVLLLALAAMIFLFSAQSGEKSSLFSEHFTENFLRLFGITDVSFGRAEHLLRKTAHFVEFFLLGTVLCLWLGSFRRSYIFTGLLSFGIALAYAALDEAHQYFVPNRSASLKDVLLDGAGALCGVLLVLLIRFLASLIRNRRGRGAEMR